jgi:hypothetical protein
MEIIEQYGNLNCKDFIGYGFKYQSLICIKIKKGLQHF